MLPSRSRSRPPPILLPFLPRRSFAISLFFSLPLPPPSLSLSLSLTTLVHNRSTRLRRSQCARANARCNGNDGRDNTDALSHAYTFTQSRIEHRLRSLSEFNDPSTRPSRARPAPSTTPSRSLPLLHQSLALARSPHTTFYLSLTSRVFFVSRSPSSPPPAFLFLQRWIYLPVFHSSPPPSPPLLLPAPTNTSLLHHTVHPPSFLSVHRFPWLSLLLIFSSPIPSLPVPRPFLLASFLPSRLFPSRRPPPPSSAMAHWSTGMVHCAVCYSRSFPSSFTIFHASATHSVQSNGSARVQRLRGKNPEGGEARERERETPFLAAATRNGISRTDNGPFRGLLLVLLQLPSVFRRHRVRRRAGKRGGNVGWDRIESEPRCEIARAKSARPDWRNLNRGKVR